MDSGDAVRCIVTSDAGCPTTSKAFPIAVHKTKTGTTTGSNTVRFYPNPVTTTLYVEDGDPADPISVITIFSNSGNRVLILANLNGHTNISVDVAGLNPGLYYVGLDRNSGKSDHFTFIKR
jgi:hypothetical protein